MFVNFTHFLFDFEFLANLQADELPPDILSGADC